jgi:hypothetical protein
MLHEFGRTGDAVVADREFGGQLAAFDAMKREIRRDPAFAAVDLDRSGKGADFRAVLPMQGAGAAPRRL